MRKNILLVISLLEGKNFPVRTDHVIIVEAVFSGECLATDPVAANAKLLFDAELAWELDQNALHLHRLQRSPVKLQFYLCDKQNRKKDNLGYLIFHIRNTRMNQADHSWFRLLNSKVGGLKPEIFIVLYLEDEALKQEDRSPHVDSKISNSITSESNRLPTSLSVPKAKGSFTSEHLKPKLNSQEGYYQIGPVEQCTEYFRLSVTLVFAENLAQLSETEVDSTNSKNYSFFYCLLGNDVTTESFRDLSKAEFPAERSAVCIRSSRSALQSYIKKQPCLTILLLCQQVAIAETNIPLEALVISDSTGSLQELTKVEGVFSLTPTSSRKQSENGVLSPGIGVSVVLEKLSGPIERVSTESNIANGDQKEKFDEAVEDGVGVREESVSSLPKDEIKQPSTKNGSVAQVEEDSPDAVPSFFNDDTSKPNIKLPEKKFGKRSETCFNEKEVQVPRHYHFILDLKTLRTEAHVAPFPCFLRYSYPFFGTATPILTHPFVHVNPSSEVLLPHGYCSFDFVTNADNLQNTFRNIPLIVEVLEDIPGYPAGSLMGIAKICLHPVMDSLGNRIADPSGKVLEKRKMSTEVPVVSPEGNTIATLKVVMGLDNLGPADLEKLFSNCKISSSKTVRPSEVLPKVPDHDLLPLMMELEVWKEQQEILFRNQLKDKEAQHLQTLTAEWKQRDVERELLVQKKLHECKQQEDRLKCALADVEVRERQLAVREVGLNGKKAETALQMKKLDDEAKDSIRRMRLECDYKVELEQKRAQGAIDEKKKLFLLVAEKDKKLREKDDAIDSLQERLRGTAEVKLRAELEIAKLEKGQLNQKLEVVTSAKNRYKEQWAKALKRVSALQQQLHITEKSEVQGKVPIYRLDEEQNTLENEKRALAKIKEEVDSLKRRIQNRSDSESFLQTSLAESALRDGENVDLSGRNVTDDYVLQLIKERDMLLSTGVYSKSDRIVVELDKHIADSSARSFQASSSK